MKRALDQTVREIELAEKHEAEARDKIWRENFRPHAIILTERTVPSSIFVAAIIGVEKLLRIDLDPDSRTGEFPAVGAQSPSGRGPRVWQTYWVCNQLVPGSSSQVRSKWATNIPGRDDARLGAGLVERLTRLDHFDLLESTRLIHVGAQVSGVNLEFQEQYARTRGKR